MLKIIFQILVLSKVVSISNFPLQICQNTNLILATQSYVINSEFFQQGKQFLNLNLSAWQKKVQRMQKFATAPAILLPALVCKTSEKWSVLECCPKTRLIKNFWTSSFFSDATITLPSVVHKICTKGNKNTDNIPTKLSAGGLLSNFNLVMPPLGCTRIIISQLLYPLQCK